MRELLWGAVRYLPFFSSLALCTIWIVPLSAGSIGAGHLEQMPRLLPGICSLVEPFRRVSFFFIRRAS